MYRQIYGVKGYCKSQDIAKESVSLFGLTDSADCNDLRKILIFLYNYPRDLF